MSLSLKKLRFCDRGLLIKIGILSCVADLFIKNEVTIRVSQIPRIIFIIEFGMFVHKFTSYKPVYVENMVIFWYF